ncbi:MAG: beta strand repeat-containing protein [Methylovulum sp.]
MAIKTFTSVVDYKAGKKTLGSDTASVTDTAANIQAGLAALLTDPFVSSISTSDQGALTIVARQYSLDTTILDKVSADDNIIIKGDSANVQKNYDALLLSDKVDSIVLSTNKLSITAAQALNEATADKVSVATKITVSDSSANINTNLADLFESAMVDVIDSKENATAINLSLAQYTTANMAKLVKGDNLVISGTSAELQAKLADLFAGKFTAINSSEDAVAIDITAAQALNATYLAKLQAADTINLILTSANSSLTAAQKAALVAETKIDTFTNAYTLTANKTLVDEGTTATFTVTSVLPVKADTVLTYQVQANTTNPVTAADVTPLTGSITILAGQSTATATISALSDNTVEFTEGAVFKLFSNAGADEVASKVFYVQDGALNSVNTVGTVGNDVLTGSTASDYLDGLAGNDTIIGNGGVDTLVGGEGDDVVTYNDNAKQILGNVGVDTLVVNGDALASAFDFSRSSNQVTDALVTSIVVRGFENINATNSPNDITIDKVNAATSSVILGSGNDVITTLAAVTSTNTVTVRLASGNDTITGVLGAATAKFDIDGGLGADTLTTGATASALTIAGGEGDDTIDASSATGANSLSGGAGVDTISMGTGSTSVYGGEGNDIINTNPIVATSVINGEAGDDTFNFATANFGAAVSLLGGDGTDTLKISNASVRLDADFTKVTGLEVVTVAAATAQTVTLGALAKTAGITTITGGTTGVDIVTVGAGFTNALTVNVNTGDDNIDASATAGALTVAAAAASITAADTLKGGTGTADVLSLTADNSGTGAVFGATVNAFESLNVVASSTATDDIVITTANGMVASTKTLTVNAAALTNTGATLTFNGAAELVGSYSITGGAGNDSITGALNTTSGTNTIDAGAGDDSITAGAKADSLTGGEGSDTFSFISANLDSSDFIAAGNGTDTLKITDASTVVDADFTKVTGLEVVTVAAATAQTVTLGALAMAAGVTTITGGIRVNTVIVGAGFTNALTVNVVTGDDNIDASATAGALTVAAAAASITAADTLKGGTGTADVLSLTADNNVTGAVFGATATGFETLTVIAGSTVTNDIIITTSDAMVASTKTLTVSAAALTDTGATLTFNGALELDGSYVITGGAGNDSITGALNTTSGTNTIDAGAGDDSITAGAKADSLTGGEGSDTFSFISANLDSSDFIAAGNGTDTLKITDASTVVDADFTKVTGLEVVTVAAATAQAVTLGALAMAAGVTTITGGTTGVDTVTVGAGFTNALTVNVNTGDDNIDASATAGALTVAAAAASITAADTLKGGTGTADVLSLTADNNVTGAVFGATATGFETLTVIAGSTVTNDIIITTSDAMVASTKTLTVSAAALTDTGATLTFNGAAELDGSYVITGGAGSDTITSGAGADSLIGGAGNDSLVGNAGNDTLDGGAGTNSLNGGAGNDSIVGGAGNDTVISGLGNDTITLSSGTDTVAFTTSALITGLATVTDFDAGTSAASVDIISVTNTGNWAAAATAKSSTAVSTTDASLVILDNASYSSVTDAGFAADNLQHNAAIKSYLYVWTDSSGVVHVSQGIQDAATEAATDQFVDLVKLTGVSITNINITDFSFV